MNILFKKISFPGVQIDKETHDIVVNVFGGYSFAGKKAKRMMYWLPKLKHTNHYLDRRDVEHRDLSDLELARTALKMICRDAGTVLTNVKVLFIFLQLLLFWNLKAC